MTLIRLIFIDQEIPGYIQFGLDGQAEGRMQPCKSCLET